MEKSGPLSLIFERRERISVSIVCFFYNENIWILKSRFFIFSWIKKVVFSLIIKQTCLIKFLLLGPVEMEQLLNSRPVSKQDLALCQTAL